jgi:hypothetical protein
MLLEIDLFGWLVISQFERKKICNYNYLKREIYPKYKNQQLML